MRAEALSSFRPRDGMGKAFSQSDACSDATANNRALSVDVWQSLRRGMLNLTEKISRNLS